LKGLDANGNKVPSHFRHGGNAEIEYENIKFFSPKEIFKKDYFLFEGKIEADDIKQGATIGDCYLMSILGNLSHRKDLILNIFRTDSVNKDGLYQIYYYDEVDGKKKIMFVDHNFPYSCDYDGKIDLDIGSLGAQPNGNEIWVLILEKCYAKYEGGYNNINYGTTVSELFWLTGGLTRTMKTNYEWAWRNIWISCTKRYVMSCNSKKGSGTHDNVSKNNIANSHSYSILYAGEFQGIKLIKLRNPWGDLEYTGDYSDTSDLWTPELKEYFGFDYVFKKEGIFFMRFEDFQNEFDTVIFCFA
jgi:calpain-15